MQTHRSIKIPLLDHSERDRINAVMKTYIEALLEINKSVNLTGARTFEKAWSLHVQDCWPIAALELDAPKQAIDFGSGNGFPGIFIAALFPDSPVMLIERTGKKARAIDELAKTAGLTNVEVVAMDGRELLSVFPQLERGADLISARAVATLDKLITICSPWLNKSGNMILWKSLTIKPNELSAGKEAARQFKLKLTDCWPYEIESYRGGQLMQYRRT